ncbi:MAG: glutamate--tRNA ligase [Acidobacteriota bacterium]
MVRTRFAPSPTGYLHIGGVRTALFNWVFARRHNGRFVLRIDDTDRQRNVEEALDPILRGFRWLGLDWDEGPEVGGEYGPYFQSERRDLYDAAVQTLLDKGLAYHDYATPADLEAERQAAQAAGTRFIYSRKWMAEAPDQRRRFMAEGRRSVVRLKMPREGACRFTDRVRGPVEFKWIQEQDHVIQRSDGTSLYHLASVVDDHEMKITHVIRAEEHLSNTPRQVFMLRGLGYQMPEYAHLPVVAEPGSKSKLSKRKVGKYLKNPGFERLNRHGREIVRGIGCDVAEEDFNPVMVNFYQRVGYLPDALINYLLLLGWSLDDRTEILTRQEMIQNFSLEQVNRSAASFDPEKLEAFQSRYMQALPLEEKVERVLPFLQKAGWVPTPVSPEVRQRVCRVVQAAGERIRVAGDILEFADFFIPDAELPVDEREFNKRILQPRDAAARLARYRMRLARTAPFDTASLEALLRAFAAAEGIGLGQIIHAVRVAVTGKAVGFGLFDTLAILGRDHCLARLDRALARVRRSGEVS